MKSRNRRLWGLQQVIGALDLRNMGEVHAWINGGIDRFKRDDPKRTLTAKPDPKDEN